MRHPDPAPADPEAELGVVSDLSSPVLCKIAEAFAFSRRATLISAVSGVISPSSEVLRGDHEAAVHIAWNPVESALVLAFGGIWARSQRTSIRLSNAFDVQADVLEIFESFISPTELGQESLTNAIRRITRGRPPRRIICTGFCMGGSLATLGAVWAALQSPTADVRCITFGAPKVGNSAFAQVFRWLVALSYRLVFHKDPMPDKGSILTGLVPVHGAIYTSKTDISMGERSIFTFSDMKDHDIYRYAGALKEALRNTSKMQAICEKAAASGTCQASDWQVPGSADSKPSMPGNNRCLFKETPAANTQVETDGNTASAAAIGPGPAGLQQAEMQFPPECILSKGAQLRFERSEESNSRDLDPPVLPGISDGPGAAQRQRQQAEQEAASSGAGRTDAESVQAASAQSAGPDAGAPGMLSSPASPSLRFAADANELCQQTFRDAARGGAAAAQSGKGKHDSTGNGGSSEQPSLKHQRTAEELVQATQRDAAGHAVEGQHPLHQPSKGIGTEEEAPGWLRKDFSLLEREDLDVLVIGKISQAVVVAGASYENEKGYVKRTGILKSRLIESKVDTQVHVGWLEGDTAVLAFRGTQSAQDGLQDAKFIRKNINYLQELYPGTKAHTGFLQQFASVVDPDDPEHNIAAVLKTLSGGREPNRVLCTGHSLGGALATLGAAWAAIEYPRADVRCITFGSPRVGNNKFKHAFHKLVGTSLRLVHGADPVPSMPPPFRYHHVKGAIHVLKRNLFLRSRPWYVKYRPNVADHLLVRYNLTVHSVLPGGDQADLPSTGASPADRERQSAAAMTAAEMNGCVPSLFRHTVSADSDPDSPTSPRRSAFEEDVEEHSPGSSPKDSAEAHKGGVNPTLHGVAHRRSHVDKDHHGAGLFKRSLARIRLGLVKA
ncbi:hypothetical protein WJX72_011847 [[Myrmecia] bisecta]|uniref:Fungal lipase-type domain-containing protein n=1 Tax=[Myrmecia] bisecta TaxID=41462 RepID=A0AAW1QB87_9CHLO